MGRRVVLNKNVSEALDHYKANLYHGAASLIQDSTVVNRILKRFFQEEGSWAFVEEG